MLTLRAGRAAGWLAGLLAALPALAAEESGGAAGLFEGGIGNSIITLIVFGIVVAVLGKYAWPRLIKTLDERESQIRGALEQARQERIEAEKILAEYRRQIDHAREEATAIVEEGRRDAAEVRRRMQEEARREAQEMIERARREIQLARDAAVKELYDRSADLAVELASRIIARSLTADDHRRLVSETLERMKAARN
jgi:F-type H+-transporting ATPase subunit b